MADNYCVPSDHLEHRQHSGNHVILKDVIGRAKSWCHDVDADRTHGVPTPQDIFRAGQIIWPREATDNSSSSSSRRAGSGSSAAIKEEGRQRGRLLQQLLYRPSGKENRPHSPFTVVMQNCCGNASEEQLADNYKFYAAEKERQKQPLKFKMTKNCRANIQRMRQRQSFRDPKDRWLMKKFQNVPSHFEQDRLAKAASAADGTALAVTGSVPTRRSASESRLPKQHQPQELCKPVLNWPMEDARSDVLPSRISATPSSSGVSAPQVNPVGSHLSATMPSSQLSAMQPAGSQASTAAPSEHRQPSKPLGRVEFICGGDRSAARTDAMPDCHVARTGVADAGTANLGTQTGAMRRPASAGHFGSHPSRSASVGAESLVMPTSSDPCARALARDANAGMTRASSQHRLESSPSRQRIGVRQSDTDSTTLVGCSGRAEVYRRIRAASAGKTRPKGCRSTICW